MAFCLVKPEHDTGMRQLIWILNCRYEAMAARVTTTHELDVTQRTERQAPHYSTEGSDKQGRSCDGPESTGNILKETAQLI